MFERKRIFVVGVPRSGTTLVQSILNAHPDVFGYPETHFFRSLFPTNRFFKAVGLVSRECWRYLDDLEAELPEKAIMFPRSCFRFWQTRSFLKALDNYALTEGCPHWSEKTPAHVQRIGYIESCAQSPYFVHVIRHPYDVVASMYEAARDYPEVWGQRTLESCCRRWNRDVATSLAYQGEVRHHLVRYEEINLSADSTISVLMRFLDLDDSKLKRDNIGNSAGQLIKSREKWKAKNSSGLHGYSSNKFRQVLSNEQRNIVLGEIDLSLWESVAALV